MLDAKNENLQTEDEVVKKIESDENSENQSSTRKNDTSSDTNSEKTEDVRAHSELQSQAYLVCCPLLEKKILL